MPQRFTSLEEWLAYFETLHPKKIDMSLDRIRRMLETLSLASPSYRVIAVGGTNGKGSCVAILESVYRHAGYKVGAFTSPHLWRFNERVRLDGADATDPALVAAFEAIEAALGTVTLSYFEASAVAAMLLFERARVDVAVLEVGMGGRLDAVNALDPDAALVASIDLDHVEWLGPDREAIGREKAGIFRRGRPAVVADPAPPASVVEHARYVGADLKLLGRDFTWRRHEFGWTYEAGASRRVALPAVAFGGDVQYANAAACVAVVESLQGVLPVADGALRRGLAGARLRGRAERHLRDGVEWLFDVAHNPAAAAVLSRTLARRAPPIGPVEALPAAEPAAPARRTLAVFGAMEDKDLAGVLAPFVPIVERWHVARPDSERGAPVEHVQRILAGLGATSTAGHADVAAACAAAEADARPGDRVVVFGSFYTVGPAIEALRLYSTPPAVGD